MKIFKIFKKIMFWFFLVISVLIVIAIIATADGSDMEVETMMIFIILIPWSIYAIIKWIKKDIPRAKARAEEYHKAKEQKLRIEEQKRKEFEEKFKGFKIVSEYSNNKIYVNEEKKKFSFGESIYNFKDLISAEIIENNDVITTTKTKKKASVGKALVGGALFGVGGAIIGGGAGKSKSISSNANVCDKLQIKLTLNSIDNPVYYIDFIKTRTYKNNYSKKYGKAVEKAEHFLGVFQVIINNK